MREGYKKTKIGEVPLTWEVLNVDSFLIDRKGAMKIGPVGISLKKSTMVEKGIKVYGQENIFVRDMEFGDRYITEEHYQKLKTCELFPGDFIISMMGTIGKCMVVPNGIQKGIMDSHLLRLQLDEEKMTSFFLKQLFRAPLVFDQINKLAVGGIMAGLSSKIVKHILFPIPPLPEQKKIASILTATDEKIEAIQSRIEATEQLKKGLMQRLLTKGIGHSEFKDSKLGKIPKSWEVVEINEVTSYVDYRGKTPPKVEKGVFLVTAKNIKKGKIDYAISKEYIPHEEYEEVMKRGKPKIGDVLITTEAPLGEVASIDREDIALAQRVIKYRSDSRILENLYLKYCFISPYFQKNLEKESTGSTVKGIKGSRLHKQRILLPNIKEQKKIASVLKSIDEKIDILMQKKSAHEQLKKGLMQKLLTGKVRVKI